MLLTGDCLSEDILEGLEGASLLKNGAIHIDVLKMPHHGSIRNVTGEFLQRVTADHYVVSADGRFDNPDVRTLEILSEARGNAEYRIHLTNHEGAKDLKARLDQFFAAQKAAGKKVRPVYREAEALSLKIDLLEAVQH